VKLVHIHRRALALLPAALLTLALGAGGAVAKSSRHSAGLTVYAAASLVDVFPAIDSTPTYSFAGSNALATQITNGAPADVFASANTTLPLQLYAQGIVEKPVTFTRNTLVIVVPKSNPADLHSIYDLANPGVKVDVAAPAVPVGAYTTQVLGQMGLTARVTPNIVSQETDVRTVLTKVQTGQVDAGFVYATDAQSAAGQVTVVKVPAWAQPKVAYGIAVVTKSPNQDAAKAFIDKVLSKQGQATMLKYGFLPIAAPVPTIATLSPLKVKAGSTVTLTGTNLGTTTSVTIKGVPAQFKVVSASRLTITIPSRAKTGQVTVTNTAGHAISKNNLVIR